MASADLEFVARIFPQLRSGDLLVGSASAARMEEVLLRNAEHWPQWSLVRVSGQGPWAAVFRYGVAKQACSARFLFFQIKSAVEDELIEEVRRNLYPVS